MTLFELAFAKLTRLEPRLARRIVLRRDSQGLAIACRAIGLDRAAFQALVRMIRKARAKDGDPAPETMASLLEFYDGVSQEAANLTLAKWQRESMGDAPNARAVA